MKLMQLLTELYPIGTVGSRTYLDKDEEQPQDTGFALVSKDSIGDLSGGQIHLLLNHLNEAINVLDLLIEQNGGMEYEAMKTTLSEMIERLNHSSSS